MPAASSTASVMSPAASGAARLRSTPLGVARRQAITGPMPESSTRISASGTV